MNVIVWIWKELAIGTRDSESIMHYVLLLVDSSRVRVSSNYELDIHM